MLWIVLLIQLLGFFVVFALVAATTKRIRVGIVAILNRLGDTTIDRDEL